MADNPQLSAGTTDGAVISGDDITVSGHSGAGVVQYVKLVDGTANGTQPIQVAGGTEANALRVTIANNSTGLISVDDNGGSLTIDGTVTANPASGTIDTVTTVGTVTTITNDVNIADGGNSITVDNGGTFAVQADLGANNDVTINASSCVHVDDAAFTLGTDAGIMAMGFAGTQSVNANDAAALACDTDGALHISDGGNVISVDDGGTALTVDWAGTAPPIGAGVEATALRVTVATDSTGVLSVDDNGGALTVDNGGTFATQVDGDALTALQLIDNSIVAHDAAISGATGVSVIGARAVASVEGQTETAAADASQINATLSGNVITQSQVAPEELVNFYVANTDGAEDAVTGLDAGGATIYNYITSIIVHNANATTQGFITLLDGSGGSIFCVVPAPATGGAVVHFSPPKKQPTINTALYVDVSAAITTMHITIGGYQGQG